MAAGVVPLATRSEASSTISLFPRPAALEPNINFWVSVFTAYSYRDFVVHDRDKVWKVYQVLHLPGDGAPSPEEVQWASDYLKIKYRGVLTRLASGQEPIAYQEQAVARLFKGEPAQNYAAAADNLRVQQGLSERFRETLVRARTYRPSMERIFRTAGLPVELTLLPSVESGFYSRARSSAGAVGIWQFTRATGRQYMKIRGRRDDRLDPLRETEAAARLLNYNYAVLGDWPLAITAYNHGTYGMERAASIYGDDFSRIVQRYDGPHFGFASKNYYAEFLAALQVHQYEAAYFPGIQFEVPPPPPPVQTVALHASGHSHRHRLSHAVLRTRHLHHHHIHRAVFRGTPTRSKSSA